MKTELPMLRTSERSSFKRCRQKWYWGQVEGLRSPRSKPALDFGTLVHDSMQLFYLPGIKRGVRPAITFARLYEEHGSFTMNEYDENDNRTSRDAGELGVAMLEAYYEKYGKDDEIEIIAPEMPFRILMKDVGGQPFWYVGRFDALGIWRPTNAPFIFEHKTGSERKKKALGLDEQTGTYWAFAPEYVRTLIKQKLVRKLSPHVELEMMLYNFMGKRMPDIRPVNADGMRLNKNGTVSKRQPQEQFERIPVYRDEDDRRVIVKRIRAEAFENRLVRSGKLPVYKNPTDDCTWDCQFFDMCELHESGSDWRAYRDQMYIMTDQYKEYAEDLGHKSPADFMEVG